MKKRVGALFLSGLVFFVLIIILGSCFPAKEKFNQLQIDRVLYLQVLADKEYVISRPDWQNKLKKVVEKISQAYYENYGIKLVVKKIGVWEHDYQALEKAISTQDPIFASRTYIYFVHDLMWKKEKESRKEPGIDILVGFTGDRRFMLSAWGAAHRQPGLGYVVVGNRMEEAVFQYELDNLFEVLYKGERAPGAFRRNSNESLREKYILKNKFKEFAPQF